ncbi:hypothetical protein HH212_13515 [Massilia forsythiae]|uniref:Uncharacterized protein n=1 Tax=Massilia forsythiae TaxID=2728020 RepID=A0A7Z2VXH0_9BURK|nr:hypothetical protein [Massilia forsythiae]QJE00915.1 hypothetical protein HH212_13515 [Massilia forsythiae]
MFAPKKKKGAFLVEEGGIAGFAKAQWNVLAECAGAAMPQQIRRTIAKSEHKLWQIDIM